jgi:pyruvate formate-lyase activating enzyme-like uncharacterized protein
MEDKEKMIRDVRLRIGWAYSDLKWLKDKEAQLANKNRGELLRSLSNRALYSFSRNKLHIGKLSPGCLICGQGYWSCMFINGLCTANCFYCPQDRGIKKERSPQAEKITFEEARDYVNYLDKFCFKGVGLSGGESLIVFEKVLAYIKEIKRRFGSKLYLWIYTNGELVNKYKLRKLKEAGLDEIRFNISSRNYDLYGVELAVGIINTVTVEIPSIPEDYAIIKKCLIKMKEIGVDHLNIHQLMVTEYNYKNFINRNYTFLHQQTISILESEVFALKLMRYALEHGINLPINYCSGEYKARLQGRGLRRRCASLIKDDLEDLTELGYIRRFSIQDSPERIKRFIETVCKNKSYDKTYSLNDAETEALFDKTILKHNTPEILDLVVSYFEPTLCSSLDLGEIGKEIKLPSGKSIFVVRKPIFHWKVTSLLAKRSLQKLLFEHTSQVRVLRYFFNNYNLNSIEDINEMQREAQVLMTIKSLEFLEVGFSEIY